MARNRSSFPLFELMIVVGFIGVLVAIVIPNLAAKQNLAARLDVEMVQRAAEAYALDHDGQFPPRAIALSGYLPYVFKNHFTGDMFFLADGMANIPGQIGYTAWFGQGNLAVDYQITLYGRSQNEGDNGIILTLRHGDLLAN